MARKRPQWNKPERQVKLVELLAQYGPYCMKGHFGCPYYPDHYIQVKVQLKLVARPGVRASHLRDHALPPKQRVVTHIGKDANGPYRVEKVPEYSGEICKLYSDKEETAIESWKAEDREERSQLATLAHQPIRWDGRYGRIINTMAKRRESDGVERDEWGQCRPDYQLIWRGLDGTDGHTYAKVRILGAMGTTIRVDVSYSVQEWQKLGKWQRKKLRARYGIEPVEEEELIRQAVDSWWASR